MLRSFLIYLSKAGWARKIVTRWRVAWAVASRFIAGETLDDALRTVGTLNSNGIFTTLDQLGEHTDNLEIARRATDGIVKMINAIDEAGVRSNVSIKLTQVGLALDKRACTENVRRIVSRANECGMFVRIDMEDTPWVDVTIAIYEEMRAAGFSNVGLVIQAYLYRSEEDIQKLAAYPTAVRLCKGAYQEPPHLAFPKKADVDANYDRLASMLMDISLENAALAGTADGKIPPIPAIASHDEKRIEFARAYAQKIGLPKEAFEFQMLNGIRRDLQERLVKEGYRVRVYVPFGTEWYPYFMRRLAERPANVWFFVSNFFRH